MRKCSKCGKRLDKRNIVFRSNGKPRAECRQCKNKVHKDWIRRNPEKRKAVSTRYERKMGHGIDMPCQYCGKMCKRILAHHFCSIECRFLSKIEKKENGCWEWIDLLSNGGYGKFNDKGTTISAHRFSYKLYRGEIPRGMCVCHICDNRKCVNPEHLWLGTAKDNMRDCVAKNRKPDQNGIKNNHAKFTLEMIEEIKNLDIQKIPRYKIAKKFNVAAGTISNVLNGKTYKV